MSNDSTRWSLSAIEGFSSSLDLTLVVDTRAPTVVEAIEEAAEAHGIVLVRIVEDDERPEAKTAESEEAEPEARPSAVSQSPVASLVVTGQQDTRHQ